MRALRPEVKVLATEGGVELSDPVTGFQCELACDAGLFANGSEDSSDHRALEEALSSLGLLAEALDEAEIGRRQRAFRRGELAEERPARLEALLSFCVGQVPYYRDRRAAYGLPASKLPGALEALPLMRKADLRAHFPKGLLAEGVDVEERLARGSLEVAATSGTTGERLQVFSDMELDSVPPEYEALWRLAPSEETPRTAVLTTPVCLGTECHLGKTPFEARIRGGTTLYLNSTEDLFSAKRDLVENIVEELHRFRPQFLLVNPFYLHWIARRAKEWGLTLPKVSLVLSCYQYLSRRQQRGIEALIGAPVYSYYFATDLSGCRLGIGCPEGRLHVREDHVFVEIVGPDGRPKAKGQLGTLAATSVANRVLPLVRYVVGDVARLVEADCPCAAGEWEVLELHGRLKDLWWAGDRWATTREFDEAMASVAGVDFYQAIQTAEDTVALSVVPEAGARLVPREIEARLEEALRLRRVRLQVQERLDPEVSLKFRLTACQFRPPPDLL